ncbi:MAG: bifunctional demethylmenaquinone methyltransferase/2-methoxy-6-polyprenyl-1,4-benzoquinol methylase UbiE [Armatimonadetes bacterium]|nr:bifunctional demethylmenaquinone methyltransferase/2-methoxy-6-polyprenyl-1,4-benzoquinol methylase UbiE [Armatimonadota bacterium]
MSLQIEQITKLEKNKACSREEYIECLFASIAKRYDIANTILSLNLHKSWRKFTLRQTKLANGDTAVDICTGTGDLAIEIARAVGTGKVIAVDFCRPMLDLCVRKLDRLGIKNISLIQGNAENLPLPSNVYKAATIGFGIRNVSNVERAFSEMARVVAPGGSVVCLEFSRPKGKLFARMYNFYSHRILPLIGGLLSGSREAYEYLNLSIDSFLSREELSDIMKKVGLQDIEVFDLTGGIVAVHVGVKK